MAYKFSKPINLDTAPIMLTVPQAAQVLSVNPSTIRNMCRDGRIKAVKVGSDWRINTSRFCKQFCI